MTAGPPASVVPASGPAPARPRGAVAFFAAFVAVWIAFGATALVAPEAVSDLWTGVRGLPLALELVVWVLTLPWLVALALLESGWPEWARVAAVVVLAVAWTLVALPRAKRPDDRPGSP